MDATRGHASPGSGRSARWAMLLFLSGLLTAGCGKPVQLSDSELCRAILGSWAFDNPSASGYMRFEPDGIMILSARGNNLALKRFEGDVRHIWQIDDGCLTVQVHDSGDLARLFFWPGSTVETPIKISHIDSQQLVLDDVGTFPRVETAAK